MYVLSFVDSIQTVMNDTNQDFVSVKNYEHAQLIQYEDFDRKHRKVNISAEIKEKPGLYQVKTYFTLYTKHGSYEIDLQLNHDFISGSFGITTKTKSGESVMDNSQAGMKHCYYRGSIRNIQRSKVFVSICKGFRGTLFLPDGVFHVEPLSNTSGSSYLFFQTDTFNQSFCPEFTNFRRNHSNLQIKRKNLHPQLQKQVSDLDEEHRYVKFVLIASKSTCDALSGNRDDIIDYLKMLSNVVDGYYQELSIHVVLIHVELWLNRDFFQTETPSDGSAVKSLTNFANYRKQQTYQNSDLFWKEADAIHVIHNQDIDSVAIGIAAVSTMCTIDALGLIRYRKNPTMTAHTLTHELGHNFGLEHVNDGKPGRNCPCATEECIMDPVTGFLTHEWSKCSKSYIRNRLDSNGYNCLADIPDPASLVLGAGCGNTIIEDGEQCDCGYKENCKSSCCDPDTCQLLKNASCDVGLCCDNCQLLSKGVVCREKFSECDFPETCSGTSPYCPQNFYKEDGTNCKDGQARCVEGACLTRDSLCKQLYGSYSSAPDRCYSVNRYGRKGGNCGLDQNSSYKACAVNDLLCGKLLCFGQRSNVVNVGSSIVFLTWPNTNCYTIGTADDVPLQEISLVPSGTVCRPNMTCSNGQCTQIAASKCNFPCKEGLCDNMGYCRCENGDLCNDSTVIVETGHPPTPDIMPLEILLIVGTNVVVAILVMICSTIFVRRKRKNVKQYAQIVSVNNLLEQVENDNFILEQTENVTLKADQTESASYNPAQKGTRNHVVNDDSFDDYETQVFH